MAAPHRRTVLLLVVALGVPGTLAAQPPRITNAQLTSQPAGDLAATFDALAQTSEGPRWIGYRVPAVDGDRHMCCHAPRHGISVSDGACCGVCRLESGRDRTPEAKEEQVAAAAGPIRLERSDHLVVLARIEDRRLDRVAVFSEDCALDAGGMPVVWLEDVRPEASLALLESIAADGGTRSRVTSGAVAAIALHRGEAADASLARLSAPGVAEAVRKSVTFWLGQARGASGLAALQRILREDASLRVQEAAVFGVSQSRAPGALEALLAAARSHGQARVRGQAIFWLGQKAGAKAAETIAERIEQDPDTDVKKRAVFALSQMPKDEGVPLLIEVARTNRNPAVRKQAMFWLAQSGDPRAIDFFAAILK